MAMSSRPEADYLKYFGVGIMKNEINTTETNLRLKVKEHSFDHATSVCFVFLRPREIWC